MDTPFLSRGGKQMQYTPAGELTDRIKMLQNALNAGGLDAALIMQSADLFYYTGTFQNGLLYVPCKGAPAYYVKRNFEMAGVASALENVIPLTSLKNLKSQLSAGGYQEPLTLGMELDVVPVATYKLYEKIFNKSTIVDCSPLIRKQRVVKSDYEIEIIRRAAEKTVSAFGEIPKFIKAGMKEYEGAAMLEMALRNRGHQGLVRVRGFNQDYHYGCFLTGKSGAVGSFFDGPLGGPGMNPAYPFGTGTGIICQGDPVMVDYVGAFEGYCIDMSRVFCLGKVSKSLQRAHEVALEIQQMLSEEATPGKNVGDLYLLAMEMVDRAGLTKHFMGCGNQVTFVAHGVGIELNELPVIARGAEFTLAEGMVMAVEPKFIFPGEGAVGIENTFLVTPGGLEKLTNFNDDKIINVG